MMEKFNYKNSIELNVLEFFCVPLYTEFLSDFYKIYEVTSTSKTNVEN